MRQCKVFVHNIEAGILQETDAKMYVFTYHEDYSGNPVCLPMPVRREPYLSNYLFPYFFNMLPEGANREIHSIVHHIDIHDDFGIMLLSLINDIICATAFKPF